MPNKEVAASATTSSPDTVRDLESMVQELQATLDKSVANARAIADEVHREADDWYEKNISRIPEEILNMPYEEFRSSGFVIPPLESSAMATISAASGGIQSSFRLKEATESGDGSREMSQHGSIARGENERALEKAAVAVASTVKAVASRGKAVALAGRNDKLARVPKTAIRMKRQAVRKARPGETLVSLAGSPVKSQPVETPVHVHIDNAEVVTLACDASSGESVQNVCKAIQEMCEK